MDWLREVPHMTTNDARIFKFQHGTSTILEITRGQKRQCWHTQNTKISSDSEWVSWLEKRKSSSQSITDGICLVLPFSEEIFRKITKELFIHSSIARVINRNTTAHCSRQLNAWGSSAPGAIVYNCRSSASWPGDIALSVTYVPERRFTYAIMYGCQSDLITIIMSRLSNCDLTTFHPLSLPMLLADIERNRHVGMVEKYVCKLLQRVLNINILTGTSMQENRSEYPGLEKVNTSGSSFTDNHESVLDWLEMNHIRDGLENWKTQLETFIQHFTELEQVLYKGIVGTPTDDISHSMRDQGTRIKDRLLQIINEYDEKIRNCSTVIDGMTFATQTEWNHIARADTQATLRLSSLTTEISKAAQRDGVQMRTIALITMTFLPGTFVATLFSMTFFDWKLESEDMVSPYIWIYVVTTVTLTVATFGIWHYYTGKVHASRRYLLPS